VENILRTTENAASHLGDHGEGNAKFIYVIRKFLQQIVQQQQQQRRIHF